jgi:hypothetical protein
VLKVAVAVAVVWEAAGAVAANLTWRKMLVVGLGSAKVTEATGNELLGQQAKRRVRARRVEHPPRPSVLDH